MHSYKYFLIYSILILAAGLLFLVVRWPQSVEKTFSQHAAAQKITIIYYILLFIVALPILYLFFAKYFVPHYHLSNTILYLLAFSSATQIGCTFIPESGGLKTTLHQTLAGISALVLILVLGCIILAPAFTNLDKIATAIGMTIMVSVIGIVIGWKRSPLPGLLLQSAYFGAFFITLLFAAY